jgi:HTH-type transcriptional regulator/antitoxin HigA
MTGRVPAEVFPPGEFLREELEERDWTQGDLAEILGRPVQAINEIVSGKKSITPETAQGLADAFGTSPELWLNLESVYRLSLTRRNDSDVSRRVKLYEKAPIRQMVRRQWIEPSNKVDDLEQEVIRFYELASIDDIPEFHAAARKSTAYDKTTPSQLAWLFRAKQMAATIGAARYRRENLEGGLESLRQLATREQEIRRVPGLLADLGIRLVIVERLPKTRIDGAAFWLDDQSPVITISLRYDRIDGFWFTLGHELWHIRNEDSKDGIGLMLDNDLVGRGRQKTADKPKNEQEADRMAAELVVSREELESFIARVRPLFSKQRIIQFSNRIGVHPGIVVGQLQHKEEIQYSHSREMLVKVRDIVTKAALTDGWGYLPTKC